MEERVTWAIKIADDYIDNRLRMSPYDVPFPAWDDPATPCPTIITDISARLAGVELYRSRVMIDADPDNNPTMSHEKYANEILDKIHAGQINLDWPRSDVTYPTVVRSTDS